MALSPVWVRGGNTRQERPTMTPLHAFCKLYEPMSPSSWRRISEKHVKDTMADKQDKCGMVLCCIKELDGATMGYWHSHDGYQYLSDLFEDSGVFDDDWYDKVYGDDQDDDEPLELGVFLGSHEKKELQLMSSLNRFGYAAVLSPMIPDYRLDFEPNMVKWRSDPWASCAISTLRLLDPCLCVFPSGHEAKEYYQQRKKHVDGMNQRRRNTELAEPVILWRTDLWDKVPVLSFVHGTSCFTG